MVNGVVLSIVAAITSLDVRSFGAAIVGALILSVISWLLDTLLHTGDRRRGA